MPSILLKSPAKINLALDILGKDEKKHFVNTILYKLDDLFDEMELKPLPEKKNVIHCSLEIQDNLILKALDLLHLTGWEITLRKNIPLQSGLGGASSNAGTILRYFGTILRIPEHELLDLGKSIGSDVPFFILEENLAYFEGYGDQLTQRWNIRPLKISIINTGIQVSTRQAYDRLDEKDLGGNSGLSEAMISCLQNPKDFDLRGLIPHVHNDFEPSFFRKFPEWKGKGHLCGSGGFFWNTL